MACSESAILPLVLASYLPFEAPDLRYIYGLFGAFFLLFLAMIGFRALGRLREARQVRRSSWRTFERVARVKGLSRIEIQILRRLLHRSRVQRPTQALSSMVTFDRLVDMGLDRGWVEDDEHAHLESARQKLVRTTQVWDGHTNRRQLERAECAFELGVVVVTRQEIDEELKIAYTEGDEKFVQAMDGLVAERRAEAMRVRNLSAGGLCLLAGDHDQVHINDYLAFTQVDEEAPVDLTGIRARVIDLQRMEEQHQMILHAGFLPYDAERRKQVIRTVYAEAERSAVGGRRPDGARPPTRREARSRAPAQNRAGTTPAGPAQ